MPHGTLGNARFPRWPISNSGMPTLAAILQLVAELPDDSVDRALATALPTAGQEAVKLMVPLLLRRMRPAGTVGLVQNFHILSYEHQQLVVQAAPELYRSLRVAGGSASNTVRANVIQIISRCRQLPLAYLVAEQLRGDRPNLHRQAAQCLAELARHTWPELGSNDSVSCDPTARRLLAEAIEQAFERLAHHGRPEVAQALLYCGSRAAIRVAPQLSSPTQADAITLRRLLAEPTGPRTVQSLYDWLTVKPVADAAVDGLRRAAKDQRLTYLLTCSHRLAAEPVRTALQRLTRDKPLPRPTPNQLQALPPAAQRGLARWINAQAVATTDKVKALAQSHQLTDPLARLSALRALIQLADHGEAAANDAIAACCFDTDPIIARLALRHLIHARFDGLPRLLPRLAAAADPTLRQLAADQLSPTAFDRFWAAWPRLTAAQRLAAAQATLKITPHFPNQLATKLRGSDRADRTRALRVVDQLDHAATYERELLILVESDDSHAASAAVRILGGCDSIEAKAAIDRALAHADSRVRANALEALERHLSHRHLATLTTMAQREDNRPRANAIRLLIREHSDTALHALTHMLADDRPRHRTSALWLAKSMGVVQIAPHVAEMSISDADPQVRAKAADAITTLLHHMHTPPTLDPDFAAAA